MTVAVILPAARPPLTPPPTPPHTHSPNKQQHRQSNRDHAPRGRPYRNGTGVRCTRRPLPSAAPAAAAAGAGAAAAGAGAAAASAGTLNLTRLKRSVVKVGMLEMLLFCLHTHIPFPPPSMRKRGGREEEEEERGRNQMGQNAKGERVYACVRPHCRGAAGSGRLFLVKFSSCGLYYHHLSFSCYSIDHHPFLFISLFVIASLILLLPIPRTTTTTRPLSSSRPARISPTATTNYISAPPIASQSAERPIRSTQTHQITLAPPTQPHSGRPPIYPSGN